MVHISPENHSLNQQNDKHSSAISNRSICLNIKMIWILLQLLLIDLNWHTVSEEKWIRIPVFTLYYFGWIAQSLVLFANFDALICGALWRILVINEMNLLCLCSSDLTFWP